MQRHMVYAALVDDCLALAAADEGLPAAIRRIAETNADFAHLGNTDGMDDAFQRVFMDKVRENLSTGFDPGMVEEQVAFLAGRLCRNAAEAVFAGLPSDDRSAAAQDAVVFRARFGPAAGAASDLPHGEAGARTERLLRALVKRAVMRTHTFKPGYEDIHTWLMRWHAKSERYQAGIGGFARLLASAPEDPGFLDPSDPLIQVAAALRTGSTLPAGGLRTALAAAPLSLYGKALRRSYESLVEFASTLA